MDPFKPLQQLATQRGCTLAQISSAGMFSTIPPFQNITNDPIQFLSSSCLPLTSLKLQWQTKALLV
jgi:hypothetical protein